jgi:hypothetical protein
MPNLKTVAEQLIAERNEERERRAQADEQARTARERRARQRAQRIAGEPAATRKLIALLDGIDAEQSDERADELVDLCRLNPDLCTARAADVLLDTAAEIADARLFAALRHLDADRRLDRDRLLDVALGALARSRSRSQPASSWPSATASLPAASNRRWGRSSSWLRRCTTSASRRPPSLRRCTSPPPASCQRSSTCCGTCWPTSTSTTGASAGPAPSA